MVQPVASTETQSSARDSAWHILSTVIPIALLIVFAIVHVQHWLNTGEFTGLGFALQESVLISLFFVRRRPKESMNTAGAWLAALIGSWGVLLLRPNGFALFNLESPYVGLQIFGAVLAIVATTFLGRSFGIVAANRGVKTDGAYRIVRHPIYASYLFGFAGYYLSSISIWNAAVLIISMAFQIKRIHAEESVLTRDPVYRDYAERVRYRLIPYIY